MLIETETVEVETKRTRNIIEILRHMAEKGRTLEYCTGPKIINRKLVTLKRYCRMGGIIFSDYCPRKLKTKQETKND